MTAALFGGSFDPPHIAHEQIAHKVLNQLKIDTLFVTPSYLNPFKEKFHFDPHTRFDLVKSLFENEPKIVVCDYELLQNQPTPTIQTVQYLQSYYNIQKLYLIIGADNLATLHLWKDFNILQTLVEFVVVTRAGFELKNDIIKHKTIHLDKDISSTYIRASLDESKIPNKIKQKVKQLWNKE